MFGLSPLGMGFLPEIYGRGPWLWESGIPASIWSTEKRYCGDKRGTANTPGAGKDPGKEPEKDLQGDGKAPGLENGFRGAVSGPGQLPVHPVYRLSDLFGTGTGSESGFALQASGGG